MSAMLKEGWNLKGFIDDGPVGDMGQWGPHMIDLLEKYSTASWLRIQLFKFIAQFISNK